MHDKAVLTLKYDGPAQVSLRPYTLPLATMCSQPATLCALSLQPYVLQELVGLHAKLFVKLPWRLGPPAHATAALAAQVELKLPTYLPNNQRSSLTTGLPAYLPTCLTTPTSNEPTQVNRLS